MSKLTGYHVTVKLFVPSPKNDFAAQAKAAQMMHDLTTTGTIGPELLAIGRVVNVTGKYGTFDDGVVTGGEEKQTDDTDLPADANDKPASKRKAA